MADDLSWQPQTRISHIGRPKGAVRPVNMPLTRASTITFEKTADLNAAKAARFEKGVSFYGRFGTPDVFAFEDAISDLGHAWGSVAVPSGLAACVLPAVAMLKAGDHLLVVDTIYEPARASYDSLLTRMGVEVEYFDPRDTAGLAAKLRPKTRMICLETPGSHTFELPDLPAIVALAKPRGIYTSCDTSWATDLLLRPLDLGIDFSVQAATKYIVGHSDAMLGVVSVTDPSLHKALRQAANWMGYAVSPDVVALALRGLRTLAVRLQQHGQTALTLAQYLEGHKAIGRVLHPGLPSHPDHAIFKRDFKGASGLFSVILNTEDLAKAESFVEALKLFSLGFSWGGYESLALIGDPAHARTATQWREKGILVRLYAGLEHPSDLIADLDQALGQVL